MNVTSQSSPIPEENLPHEKDKIPKSKEKPIEFMAKTIKKNNTKRDWKNLNKRLATFKSRYIKYNENHHEQIKKIDQQIEFLGNSVSHSKLKTKKGKLVKESKELINPQVIQTIWKINKEQGMLKSRCGPYEKPQNAEEDFNLFISNVFNFTAEELQYAISHMDKIFPQEDIKNKNLIKFILKKTKPVEKSQPPKEIREFIHLGMLIKNYITKHPFEAISIPKFDEVVILSVESSEVSQEAWEKFITAITNFKIKIGKSRLTKQIKNEQLALFNLTGPYAKAQSNSERFAIFLSSLFDIPSSEMKTAFEEGGLFGSKLLKGPVDFVEFFTSILQDIEKEKWYLLQSEFNNFVDEVIIAKSARDFINNLN